MHAFLLVGQDNEKLKAKSEELAKESGAKVMEYPLVKIEDVRNLNNFLRLTITEPTLIYVPNIHETGTEALNAFLKNLEEPQENLYFVLTAPSIRKVLPTIVSRCQIVHTVNSKQSTANSEEIEDFLSMDLGQRSAFFDRMKERDKAIEFVESLIFFLHDLPADRQGRKDYIANMEILLETLTRLKANGNVNLQLTNLAIKFN